MTWPSVYDAEISNLLHPDLPHIHPGPAREAAAGELWDLKRGLFLGAWVWNG